MQERISLGTYREIGGWQTEDGAVGLRGRRPLVRSHPWVGPDGRPEGAARHDIGNRNQRGG
jgi:hypothetical protein